ncbi:MAG: GntR family transcriptional regulator [Chloroflexota bacterium]|nr:GntR family transcriptional regulator [Chloroflexota bacterium]
MRTNTEGSLFKPIKSQSLSEAVCEVLRNAIVEGQLLPGQQLDTHRLADQLGVSQTPVRYAIGLLAKDGLVEVRPRSATLVRALTAEDLSEIMDIRRALELLACDAAVIQVSDSHIARLKRLAQEVETSFEWESTERAAPKLRNRLNSDFHELLVELSGNKRLVQLYKGLQAHEHIARVHEQVFVTKNAVAKEAKQHRSIIAALERRDLARLRKAVDWHIRFSKALLMRNSAVPVRMAANQNLDQATTTPTGGVS